MSGSSMSTSMDPSRFAAAVQALAAAEAALRAADDDACEDEHTCALAAAYDAASAEVDAIREALEGSDTPRTWQLIEGGDVYDTITASSVDEALAEARDNVDRANYPDCDGTLWVDVRVRCVETGETDSATVTLAPEEPECSEGEHDWQSPFEIVGGAADSPGVWANGGGVIIREVCMRCGCGRTTDTWATDPSNGTQGHRSISYEPGLPAEEDR